MEWHRKKIQFPQDSLDMLNYIIKNLTVNSKRRTVAKKPNFLNFRITEKKNISFLTQMFIEVFLQRNIYF